MEIVRPVIKKVSYRQKAFLERSLPEEGELSVKVGDFVKPFDIIGSTFLSLDRKEWKLNSSVWQVLVTDGSSLGSGEILARKRVLLPLKSELIRMPFSGTVSVTSGKISTRIEAVSTAEKYSLVAGISAGVEKIVGRRSVLLATEAYVVSGVFAAGKEVIGEIKLVGAFESPLVLSQITPELTAKIVVGGSFASAEVIGKAQALGVTGLVVGGASVQSIRSAALPVLLTEGLGRIPMNKGVFDYLATEELKTAILSPGRKQLIVPSPRGDHHHLGFSEKTSGVLKPGQTVQIFAWPVFGYTGKVVEIGGGPSRLASGIEDIVVKVKVDGGEITEVPVSNLGILE